jgi:hypothetical protein
MMRPRLKPLARISTHFRMFVWRRRWVRRMPRVSYRVREGAIDPLAALAHQATAAPATYPSAIDIPGPLRLRLLRPVAAPTVRLRHVGADAHGIEVVTQRFKRSAAPV